MSKASTQWFKDVDQLLSAVQKDLIDGDQGTIDIDLICREGEEVLRRHIQTDIYGVDRRGAHSWVRRSKYARRGTLADDVYSVVQGDKIFVTSKTVPNDPIRKNSSLYAIEDGDFLKLLEVGKLGFLTKRRTKYSPSFPRPAVLNAQAEVDSPAFINSIRAKMR